MDRFEQFVLLDRFEQLGVDAQLARSGRVAWPLPGSQQDDACGSEFGSFADHGGHRQAIQATGTLPTTLFPSLFPSFKT
jgi:hypothetical protein